MPSDIQLKTVLTAEDKMSASVDKASMSIGKLAAGVALGNVAYAAFSKVVSTATDFIKQSIDASSKAEASDARVNAILKTLTGNYQEHAKAVAAAGRAAVQLGFDDEDAQESMAKLLQVTKNTSDAQTALSAAMDLARFKGIDLESATQAMTMAFQGSGKILKQLGIDVPDNASKMEILGLVHQRVAGQAEAFGKTAAGAQQIFAVSLENVKEKVGSAFLPALTSMLKGISAFVSSERFSLLIDRLNEDVGALSVLISTGFNANMKALAATFGTTAIEGKAAFTAIDLAIAPIAGAVTVVNKAFQLFLGYIQKVNEAMEKFNKIVSSPGTALDKYFDFVMKPAQDALKGKASGGPVSGGESYIVGERGPELFTPSGSGRITPNDRMGGTVVNFNNPVVRSESDLQAILDQVNRALSRKQQLAKMGA